MPGNAHRWIALLGRRDGPTDGVADYCTHLGAALGLHGYELEIAPVPWRNEAGALRSRIYVEGLKIGGAAGYFCNTRRWGGHGEVFRCASFRCCGCCATMARDASSSFTTRYLMVARA